MALAWVAGLGTAISLAWLFGLPELAALAVAVGMSLALAAGWVLLARPPGLVATIEPAHCNQGETATLLLRFSAGPSRPSCAVRLSGRLGTAGNGIVAVSRLPPGGTTTVRVSLPTPNRGLVRVSGLKLRVIDPLGLFRLDTEPECTADLLVRPPIEQIRPLLAGGGRQPAPGRRTGSASPMTESDSELVGLRPYVRGDDVRRIHWRTSARLGEPHVVQVEPPTHSPGTTVLLDQSHDSTAEGFERAVSAAASVLVAAAAAGRSVRLLTHNSDGSLVDSGRTPAENVGDLLDTLATVTRMGDGGGDLHSGVSESDTVVWCTASTAADTAVPNGVDTVVTCDRAGSALAEAEVTQVSWSGTASLSEAWAAATGAAADTAAAP